jgi:hypothetical protein
MTIKLILVIWGKKCHVLRLKPYTQMKLKKTGSSPTRITNGSPAGIGTGYRTNMGPSYRFVTLLSRGQLLISKFTAEKGT